MQHNKVVLVRFNRYFYERWQPVIDAGIDSVSGTVPNTPNTSHQIWFLVRGGEPIGMCVARPFPGGKGEIHAEIGLRVWKGLIPSATVEAWIRTMLRYHPVLVAQVFESNSKITRLLRSIGATLIKEDMHDQDGKPTHLYSLTRALYTRRR